MSATATLSEPSTTPLTGYVPVQVQTLRSSKSDVADLFVQFEPGVEPRLYCRAGSRPDERQFAELAESGVELLYVRSADFHNFSNDLLNSLQSVLQNRLIPSTEKFATLQIAVAVAIEQTMRLVDCGRFRALAEEIGADLVTLLDNADVSPRELFRMARHDFSTFTHVTNVASYNVILAQKLGTTDQNELRKIASAAILHDLGKRFIPASILTKMGRLTDDEREVLQSHPLRGYTELCQKTDFEFGQLMMVYQHHERVDGTGYPVRVRKEEIHPWARMLAIVDVFDTMTAKRPNSRSLPPEHVLEFQRQQAGTQFDGDFVECWISAMTKT